VVVVGVFERGVSDGLSKDVEAYVHDVPLYQVQTARQCAEFHPIELYVWTLREPENDVEHEIRRD
jgi:hypothetical protein